MIKLEKAGEQIHEQFGSLTTIKNESNDIFFIGKEICEILGYANPGEVIQDHIREKHKVKMNNSDLLLLGIESGRKGDWLISEAGLYTLVLKSKMPNAEMFQDWIVEDVLPSIRKTGSYSIQSNQKPLSQIELIIQSAQQLLEIQQEQEKQAERIAVLEAKITSDSEFYTISGYCALRGLKKTTQECNILGRKATKMSKELDYSIGSQSHASYGRVNTYHLDILTQIVK